MSSSYSAMESAGWHWMQPGMPEHLVWRERLVPIAPAAHVVVRNRAIGLNPVDWKFIEWGPAFWSGDQIPGVDGAGEVVAVGDGVSPDWLGQLLAGGAMVVALLMGLVLAHAELVAERRGAPAILLLDEVAAHLDPQRRAALYDRLSGRGQVWMTATEESLFDGVAGTRFHVDGGTVTGA